MVTMFSIYILAVFLGPLHCGYKLGKARQRAEFRRVGRKIEVRRIAAKQAGERMYDQKKEN